MSESAFHLHWQTFLLDLCLSGVLQMGKAFFAAYTLRMPEPLIERFCTYCAKSLLPLDVPHTSRTCATCGKTKYHAEPGEGGKGIKIEAGDSFAIPSDWLTMSFDPAKSRGELSRSGMQFLLQQFMLSWAIGEPADLITRVGAAAEAWEAELQASDKLAGIDLQAPDGGEKAWGRLKDDQESWEFYMLSKCLSAVLIREAIEANDAQSAAHAALLMGLQHCLTVVLEPYLHETIWRGYQVGIAVHESSIAAEHVPGEVEALAELDPLFKRIGEATLRTWLDSGASFGPRLGVTKLPEPHLVARAKWHVEEFNREREEKVKAPSERRAWWDLTLKGLGLLVALLGSAAFGAIVASLSRT